MWMTEYIQAVQKGLIEQHGIAENPDKPGLPLDVPDGEYPTLIDGKIDKVKITNGTISCCNFN